MGSILPPSLVRAVKWAVDEQRMMLAAEDAMCDLDGFRSTLEMARQVANPSAALSETTACLEAEIAARERAQERARRVVSDGNNKSC